MIKSSSRRGFTLPEVLVTVTIVAVLAAVMVPAVLNQVGKGDKPAIAEDFSAIRTAITTFAADTRHFPKTLGQLTGATLSQTTAFDVNGTLIGTDAANYRGPYLPTDSAQHIGPTGGKYANTFILNGSLICMRDTLSGTASTVSDAVVAQVDSVLDNHSGLNAGVVTWTETTPGTRDPQSLRVCLASK